MKGQHKKKPQWRYPLRTFLQAWCLLRFAGFNCRAGELGRAVTDSARVAKGTTPKPAPSDVLRADKYQSQAVQCR